MAVIDTNNGRYASGTFAADGSSDVVNVIQGAVIFVGGAGGTDFGSGTVTVQVKGPDGQFYASADSITARDVQNVTFSRPCEMKLVLSGSSNPDLDWAIQTDFFR